MSDMRSEIIKIFKSIINDNNAAMQSFNAFEEKLNGTKIDKQFLTQMVSNERAFNGFMEKIQPQSIKPEHQHDNKIGIKAQIKYFINTQTNQSSTRHKKISNESAIKEAVTPRKKKKNRKSSKKQNKKQKSLKQQKIAATKQFNSKFMDKFNRFIFCGNYILFLFWIYFISKKKKKKKKNKM